MKSNLLPAPRLSPSGSRSRLDSLLELIQGGYFVDALIKAKCAMHRRLFRLMCKMFGVGSINSLSDFLGKSKCKIIDAGAADGFHPRWTALGENKELYLFEPEPKAFLRLQEQYVSDSTVKVLNTALSHDKEPLTLNVLAWPRASSVYELDDEFISKLFIRNHFSIVERISIQPDRLDEYMDDPDFIKADVEGHELSILIGAGKGLANCIGLELEVYFLPKFYRDRPLFRDVDAFCHDNGFTLIKLRTPGYLHFELDDRALESSGIIAPSDALYFRLPSDIIKLISNGHWGREKLFKAAGLYLCYRQYELAFVLLKEAYKNNVVDSGDSQATALMRVIDQCSGRRKLATYNRIKKALTLVLGLPIYDPLEH